MHRSIFFKSINCSVALLLLANTFVLSINRGSLSTAAASGSEPTSFQASRPSSRQSPTEAEVSITDTSFAPAVITVTVGSEVTWVNDGTKAHGVTVPSGDVSYDVYLPLIISSVTDADRYDSSASALGDSAASQDSWSSGPLLPGQSFTRAFNKVGIVEYLNSEDSEISGTVIVEPANQAPTVTIDSPVGGTTVGVGTLLVSGTVNDDGQVTAVTVNGVAASLDGATFEATFPATNGNLTILAEATDDDGAMSLDSVVVLVDGDGPVIDIVAPRQRQSVYTDQPFLDILYADFGDTVDTSSLQVSLIQQDGGVVDVLDDLTISADRAYGAVSAPLVHDSVYTLTTSLSDTRGNNAGATAAFYVPIDPGSLIPPTQGDQAGWVSGQVYDSSTCDADLTQCAGLTGALVTVEQIDVEAVADKRAQRQAQTMARLAGPEPFEPLGPSLAANLTTPVTGTAVTGPGGFFAFPLNETGIYWLRVEKDGFTYGQREVQVVRQRSSTSNAIYLTPIDPVVTPCDSAGCSHTNSDASIKVDIPVGAIAGGQSVEVTATTFDNVEFLPSGDLPPGTWETYAFNLAGASEITFTMPVSIQVKNTLGFSPGITVPLGYWNQNTLSWEHEGLGIVDGTGEWINTSLSQFSNHDLNFPVTLSDVELDVGGDEFDHDDERDLPGDEKDEPCSNGAGGCFVNYKSGTLHEWVDTPPVAVLGQPLAQQLAYSSDRAVPSEVIDVRVSLKNTGSVQSLGYMGYELYIQGEKTATHYIPVNLTFTGELGRLRYLWDGRNAQGDLLSPGAYQYQVKLTFPYLAEYCRSIGGIFGNEPNCLTGGTGRFVPAEKTIWKEGTVTLHGDPESPFGIGWTVGGMQQLLETEAGDIVIVDGQRHDEFYFPQKDKLLAAELALQGSAGGSASPAINDDGALDADNVPERIAPAGPDDSPALPMILPELVTTAYVEQTNRAAGADQVSVDVCGAIGSDTTWTQANLTYVVTCDVAVQPGITLTIEPGVTVQFQAGLSLAVSGSLLAQGTEGSPITFEAAGATAPASWKQIAFLAGSSSVLDHVVVQHGGSAAGTTPQYGAVTIASSDVSVTNSTLQANGVAIYAGGGAQPTISGSAFLSNTAYYGGAIYAKELAALTIVDSEFSFNQAGRRGGAIFAVEADLDIRGSRFYSNTTVSNYGGALAIDWHGSADLFDNHFEDNKSNGGGGGAIFIYNELRQTTIVSNTFLNNEAVNREGGAVYDESHRTIIKDNVFIGSKGRDGGAIYHQDYFYTETSALIEGNIFRDGQARNGAALMLSYNGDPIARNNLMVNNVAEDTGGAVQIYGPATLEHNVIYNNRAEFGGGIVNFSNDGLPHINNNIVVSNTATFSNASGYLGGGGIYNGSWLTFISLGDHNLVWGNEGLDYQDLVPGPNDIADDPLFVDPANGDFHLQAGSPAVDAGGPGRGNSHDFEGDQRPMGLAPDIGLDEFRAFGVAKESSARIVPPGGALTYTVNLANVENNLISATLTDTLPASFSFTGYESGGLSCSHDGASVGGTLICSGDLAANSQESITITMVADASPSAPMLASNVVTATVGGASVADRSDVWLSWCAVQVNDGPIGDDVQAAIDDNSEEDVIKVSGRCFVPGGLSLTNRTLQGGWNRDFSVRAPGLYPTTLDAEYKGTVVYLTGAAILEDFTITGGSDSGVYAWGTSVVRDNIIERNVSRDGGGVTTGQAATIQNNVIRHNRGRQGGGIYDRTEDVNHLIDGNIIHDNYAAEDGGGIYVDWGGRLRNNMVYGNEAGDDGGGLFFDSRNRSPSIEHNTFFDNQAGVRGGGLALVSNFGWSFATKVRNNAVISNTATDGGGIFLTSTMNGLDYNNVWGNGPNEYNTGKTPPANDLSADPLFRDPQAADFHLTAGSPMIDAADPLSDFYPDFEGDPRPMGQGGSDIGADEYPARTAFSRTETDYSRLEYDPSSNTYTRIDLDNTIVHFDAENRHDYTLDPDGTRTTYTYDGDGHLASIAVTAPGRSEPDWTWALAYSDGKLASITDPASRVTSFTIDANNHLVAALHPDGATQAFTYNVQGLMTQHQDENGDVTDFVYDDYGRIHQIVDPAREIYDTDSRTSSLQRVVRTFTPSDTSYPLLNDRPSGTPASPGPAVPRSVDLRDRIENGRGEISGRTDRWGFWASRTDGLGRTTAMIRDLDGQVLWTTYPDGDCAGFIYDENGNKLSETRLPAGQCVLPPADRDPSLTQKWSWTYEPQFNQVKSETDPNGNTTEYLYDHEVGAGFAGNVVQITHPEVDDGRGVLVRPVEQFNYNDWGLIEAEIDPRGTVTRYVYSQGTAEEASDGDNPLFNPGVTPVPGLLTQVIEDYGGENLIETYKAYDAAGNPGLTIGPGGHNATSYVYDPMNRIIQETDAVGVATTYVYDGRGNLVQEVVDAGGRDVTTYYEFNAEDQLVRRQVEDGLLIVETSFKYDINQQPALVEDSQGNQSIYIFDNADQLINVIDPAGHVVTYTYSLDGHRASMVDADGYTRQYEYDAFDRKVAEISDESGLALTTEFAYDLNGNLLTTTDPAGTTTCFSYDALNRLTSRTADCGGQNLTTAYALDLNGNALRVTDHRGVITRREFDTLNRQVGSFLDAGGLNLEIRFGYDAAGNLAETRDMRGTVTQLSFDKLNRVTQQCEDVHGLNLCSQFTFDSLGNQETTVDPNGIVTLTTFNGFGRPIEIVRDMGGLGATTTYSYDNNLNTASVTDANGNGTHYAYTSRNELSKERFADGTLVNHVYNGRGFVTARTNQDGTTIAHEYDGAGRMIGIVFSDGGVQIATYDGAGRITSASQTMDGHTTSLSRDYNGLGDVISETQFIDGRSWALSYDHDYPNGVYTLTYPSGTQTVHATDALARVDDIRNNLGQTVADYDYDDVAGQRSLSYVNGVTTQVEIDPLNRVTRIQSDVAVYQYGYDGSGNRTYLKRDHLPGQPADVYQYDGLYRPIQVWYGADATDPGSINTYDRQQSFDLDLLSNRLQMNDDGALIDYAPSDGQQLANSMNRYETVDGRTYTYDLRGNTLSDGVITYTYDILNRQIGIDGPANDAQYVFNPFGYRVATIVDGTITYFVYDNQGQVLEERAGSDLLLARYTYGPSIDIPVTVERGGTTYYYHRDAQNSITEITDSAGDLVERYSYDIYGRVTIYDAADNVLSSSGIDNPYFYTGRRLDAESGNYYFRARVYSPELGRFLQMDPLGYVDGQNLYASYFVINGTDPSGTSALLDLLADLSTSLPDINVSAGISIEAKSPPILGPVGVYGKMETKFTLGTCCEQGKIKNFVQHDVVVMVGFHVGLPGIFVSPAIQTKIASTKCPKEGPFSCQGVVSVNVSAGPVSGACSMKWDGSWSCGASLFGFGGDYGSSGFSGSAGGNENLINNQGIPPTKLGLSVGGGIECSKVEVT